METQGLLSPTTVEEAQRHFEALGPAAQTVTKEVAKAMAFDREEYRERVTSEVVGTAREALFASLLQVHRGSRAEFETWIDEHPDLEPRIEGAETVDHVAWHPVPFEGVVVAVTYQNEPEAAVGTLQRQAFGRQYRSHV